MLRIQNKAVDVPLSYPTRPVAEQLCIDAAVAKYVFDRIGDSRAETRASDLRGNCSSIRQPMQPRVRTRYILRARRTRKAIFLRKA